MGNKNSTAAGNSGCEEKTKQLTDHSKDAPAGRQTSISIDQNVFVIWLDNNIDEANDNYRNMLTQLRHVVNTVNTITDGHQCVTFLSENKDDKFYLILSGSLAQHIVPIVHDMFQVDSIFIFCDNVKTYELWMKEWPKVRGIFTVITPICEILKQATLECEYNASGITFVSASGDASMNNFDQLDASFMYTQILKEILLTIEFDEHYFKQFIDHCREVLANNDVELKNVKEMERSYRDKTPIWWYTYASFLHPMLHTSLRNMDIDVLIKIGFFIGDLHRHIEQLHSEQFGDRPSQEVLNVYRGDGLSKNDFEQLMGKKGGLVSLNSFLSTSKDQKVSLESARRVVTNPDMVGILFVMTIDPSISLIPFASINNVSYFQSTKDEVLFSMHTVFRIHEIKQIDEYDGLWQVNLTLTTDCDQDLLVLTESMREETDPNSKGWVRLGNMLIKLGQFNRAQQILDKPLEEATDDREKANIYRQLGYIKKGQAEYEEAIKFYEKSLKIFQKILPPNHRELADFYNNISSMYNEMEEYSKALAYFEKALEIREKTPPPGHSDSYNNIC